MVTHKSIKVYRSITRQLATRRPRIIANQFIRPSVINTPLPVNMPTMRMRDLRSAVGLCIAAEASWWPVPLCYRLKGGTDGPGKRESYHPLTPTCAHCVVSRPRGRRVVGASSSPALALQLSDPRCVARFASFQATAWRSSLLVTARLRRPLSTTNMIPIGSHAVYVLSTTYKLPCCCPYTSIPILASIPIRAYQPDKKGRRRERR